ncbi:MAG: uncharacterized protein KVP18_000780 [Porospora cf. gigantea A]|uniref:uncharacterized protein n=1 Tax=Porospora cf. gigantea A TaxID=2853593 RepID=UPI00355996DF|nr:MAG: hypothetical protein KVP18_000780 [Porospora cf. gigantea A]
MLSLCWALVTASAHWIDKAGCTADPAKRAEPPTYFDEFIDHRLSESPMRVWHSPMVDDTELERTVLLHVVVNDPESFYFEQPRQLSLGAFEAFIKSTPGPTHCKVWHSG